MSALAIVSSIGIGTCTCHAPPVPYTTTIISGVPTVSGGGNQVAVIGSIGISSCGHSTTALIGSPFVRAGGVGVHRVGDTGINCGTYTVISGTPNIISK